METVARPFFLLFTNVSGKICNIRSFVRSFVVRLVLLLLLLGNNAYLSVYLNVGGYSSVLFATLFITFMEMEYLTMKNLHFYAHTIMTENALSQ